jgi:drug/metabolite transporter (DMT)-like permease
MKNRASLFTPTDLLLLVTIGFWAINLAVIKNVISGSLPPLSFTALRFALGSIILLPLLRGLLPAERAVTNSDRWKIVGLGLIGNTFYQLFFITGMANTTPTSAALILATPPIFIVLIGALFKLEQLSWWA